MTHRKLARLGAFIFSYTVIMAPPDRWLSFFLHFVFIYAFIFSYPVIMAPWDACWKFSKKKSVIGGLYSDLACVHVEYVLSVYNVFSSDMVSVRTPQGPCRCMCVGGRFNPLLRHVYVCMHIYIYIYIYVEFDPCVAAGFSFSFYIKHSLKVILKLRPL